MPTPVDKTLSGIASQSFRTVRKGFDPDEVRAYLKWLDAAVAHLSAEQHRSVSLAPPVDPTGENRAEQAVAEARATADAMVAQAQNAVAELESRQAALQAWFGEDGRADPGAVPPEVTHAATRANALVRAAQVQVDELLRGAEAQVETLRADRWTDLGDHVARILANAEQEALAIRVEAEQTASTSTRAVERDRALARDQLAEAQLRAQSLLSEAEATSAELRQSAEPRARAHIAEVLAQAESELDSTRTALRDSHRRLDEVYELVGRSLAERLPEPVLADAASFPLAEPEPEPQPAPEAVRVAAPATPTYASPEPQTASAYPLWTPPEPATPEPVTAGSAPGPTAAATAMGTDPTSEWVDHRAPGPESTPVAETQHASNPLTTASALSSRSLTDAPDEGTPAPGFGDEAAWEAFIGSQTVPVGAEQDSDAAPRGESEESDDPTVRGFNSERGWVNRLRPGHNS